MPPVVLAVVALGMAGCGGGDDRPTLRVSAAASLKQAFEDYGASFDAAAVSFSFAGSQDLAGQIRSGGRPDVFAAANKQLPRRLHADGLVERPVVFAANRLVLAVPADDAQVSSPADLDDPRVRIAAAAPDVPAGAYVRALLARLGAGQARAIERNIRSHEPDVAGVVAKVSQGAVDAGFVYLTDVVAAGGRLTEIDLPPPLSPRVRYAVAVVKGSEHAAAARAFVAGLATRQGRAALARAGFRPAGP